MRRFLVLPLAALLVLVVAAPVAAGPNTSNTSGTGRTVYGDWSDGSTFGYAYFGQEKGQPGFGELYQESGEWVECSPPEGEVAPEPEKIAPADTGPGDGYYGFVGTRTFGYSGDVEITFSRRLETGTVTGHVELWTETVDECAGTYGDATYELADLSIQVTGVGDVATFRGSGSYKIPSEFNGHQNYRGKERMATGSILAGPIDAEFGYAYMSEVTWTEHVNS
jgi:hypothetical protein